MNPEREEQSQVRGRKGQRGQEELGHLQLGVCEQGELGMRLRSVREGVGMGETVGQWDHGMGGPV